MSYKDWIDLNPYNLPSDILDITEWDFCVTEHSLTDCFIMDPENYKPIIVLSRAYDGSCKYIIRRKTAIARLKGN